MNNFIFFTLAIFIFTLFSSLVVFCMYAGFYMPAFIFGLFVITFAAMLVCGEINT